MHTRSSRHVPAAMSPSASAALAYRRRGSGQGHRASPPAASADAASTRSESARRITGVSGHELGCADRRVGPRMQEGDRCAAARRNSSAARWRSAGSRACEAVTPRAHSARPHQSPSAGRSTHRPSADIRLRMRPIGRDGIRDEGEVGMSQSLGQRSLLGLADRHDQPSSRVVHAVSVLGPRHVESACSNRPRSSVSASRWANDGRARARSCRVDGRERRRQQPIPVRHGRPAASVRVAEPGLVHRAGRVIRGEDAPEGVCDGLRVGVVDENPRPAGSISIACGNRVATTGMPAATASARTPEVACSCDM